MMIVRELISRFGFKVDEKGFQKANEGFSKIKKAAVALVGVLVAGKVAMSIRNITKEVSASADMFDKMSLRVGISTDALQEYDFVARLAGTSSAEFELGIRRLQRSMDEAAQGTASYADDFKRLGIRLRDSEGKLKSAEAILPEMGDAFKKLSTDTERVALAQAMLGRSGTSLLPVLMQGTEAINAQRKEARELGFMDKELIKLGVVHTDTQFRLTKVMTGFKNIIAKALLPGMIKTKTAIIEWYVANRELIAQKLGNFIRQIISVVKSLAGAVWKVTKAIHDWVKSLDPLSFRILKLSVALGVLAVALMSPIATLILLAVLVGMVVDDFTLWWENTGEVNTLMGDLDEVLGGIPGRIRDIIKEGKDFTLDTIFGNWATEVERVIANIKEFLGLKMPKATEPTGGKAPKAAGPPEIAAQRAEELRAKRTKEWPAWLRATWGRYPTPLEESKGATAAMTIEQKAVAPPGRVPPMVNAPVTINNLNVQAAPGETVTEQTRGAMVKVAEDVIESKIRIAGRTATQGSS